MAKADSSKDKIIAHVRLEYQRWLSQIGDDDPYVGQTTIGIREVLRAHFLLAEYFASIGEGIGGIGPKDINLLHSAMSRQFVQYDREPRWKDRIQVYATLMYGLIKNHPFYDANKRTAFLVSILHLQKIGRTPAVDGAVFEDFTVEVAEGKLQKYKDVYKINKEDYDGDILVIANFLKRSTRDIKFSVKSTTYNAFNLILRGYGLELQNPRHNRIDVVRVLNKSDMSTLAKPIRIGKIGFHAWSTQVSKKDMHTIRSVTELDIEHGYDSQSFFYGVSSSLTLIKKYEEPLKRLAYR